MRSGPNITTCRHSLPCAPCSANQHDQCICPEQLDDDDSFGVVACGCGGKVDWTMPSEVGA